MLYSYENGNYEYVVIFYFIDHYLREAIYLNASQPFTYISEKLRKAEPTEQWLRPEDRRAAGLPLPEAT